MDVYVYNEQSALEIPHDTFQSLATQVIANEGHHYDEVSIHFVDTKRICELHEQFFNDPSPTDCISFPIDDLETEGYRVLGDVFVCTDTAIEYAKEHGLDPYDETTLYVVHGLLHLMGYDDIEDEDRIEMRAAEERHLKKLK